MWKVADEARLLLPWKKANNLCILRITRPHVRSQVGMALSPAGLGRQGAKLAGAIPGLLADEAPFHPTPRGGQQNLTHRQVRGIHQ